MPHWGPGLILLLVLLLAACAPVEAVDSGGNAPGADSGADSGGDTGPTDPRCPGEGSTGTAAPPLLAAAELLADTLPASPIDSAAFGTEADADDPLHPFNGRLRFSPTREDRVLWHAESWFTDEWLEAPLPDFDAEYVQCGRDLLPTSRGRVQTDNAYWDLILSPGRSWSNPADEGYTRVALPFALTPKYVNCVANGLLTFLYDGERTSQVRWQVTQETCHLLRFDAWGQAPATYTPTASSDPTIDAWVAELARRPEVRDFAELAVDHPEVDLDQFDIELSLEHTSARGLLVDDVLYLDRCRTRYGDDPFCAGMVLPSFSLAKTAYTSLAMAAMAQEFPTDPYPRTTGELLGVRGTWGEVSLEHLIDMATGHYLVDAQTDPDVPGFYGSLDLEGRLDATFALPYKRPPGEAVVYLTPNSQVAAAALDAHLVDVGSDETDSFAYLVDRVLEPAGVSPESHQSLRTWEAGGENNGTAFGGYGMWFTPYGISALGAFLQRGGDGLLHPDRLAETLFQTEDRGASMNFLGYRYNNGMWGFPTPGCDVYAPILFGVSGITVIVAPNGLVYFAFTDAQEFPVANVLEQLDRLRPICP